MKYQVVLLGTPWNQDELTHGVLSVSVRILGHYEFGTLKNS